MKFVIATILSLASMASVAHAADTIQGNVTVAPALSKKTSTTGVLYIIARSASAQQGPPVAVVRIDKPTFPQKFEIGPKDMMLPGEAFKGPFVLTAKLSKKGDAITQSGDLLGAPSTKAFAPGAKDAQLTLDKEAP